MPLLRSYAATPEANTERTFSDSFVKAVAAAAVSKDFGYFASAIQSMPIFREYASVHQTSVSSRVVSNGAKSTVRTDYQA